jgi:hypothetical protein
MSTGCKIVDKERVYFLTLSVVNWVDVFSRQIYRDIIIDNLKYCQKNKGLVIFAYVIMSNHIHLLVQSLEEILSPVFNYPNCGITLSYGRMPGCYDKHLINK